MRYKAQVLGSRRDLMRNGAYLEVGMYANVSDSVQLRIHMKRHTDGRGSHCDDHHHEYEGACTDLHAHRAGRNTHEQKHYMEAAPAARCSVGSAALYGGRSDATRSGGGGGSLGNASRRKLSL
jgi:hypothetical protein